MKKLKKLAYDYDPHMLLALMVLWGIALIGVYSATYREGTSILFYKQLIYMIVGWFLILVLSRMNFRALYDLAPVIYLFNLLLLILVPIFGKTVYGAKRWLDLGPVSLQPSEFFKFSLVLFSIYVLSHTKGLLSKDFLILLLSFAIPAILTLKQPDLGTAVIYIFILALALFLHGVKLRYFFLVGAGLLLLSPLLWHLLKGYQKARILAIIDPYKDYHGSGYQLIQSMIAIGSGQLWGKGLLDGTQSRLLFLPEKHTDFIFSVIAEEGGFLVSFTLIFVAFFLFYRTINYALTMPRGAERLYLGVFSGLWLFQTFLNFMMAMGWAPVVGIPLPFVSYGGSSLLTFSLLFGLLLSILREQRNRPIRFEVD